MAKKKTGTVIFKCATCGFIQPRWLGRCPECGEWNTFEECIEETVGLTPNNFGTVASVRSKPVLLSAISPMEGNRMQSGILEFDRVLGGGAMMRSAVLIGGEPGIGKSTLLLQAAAAVSKKRSVLYVSGEESNSQIRNRADRLQIPFEKIQVLSTNRFEDIEQALKELNPEFVVIDSIQTVYSPHAGSIPGTVNQLKLCAQELITWVKEHEAVLLLSAHITKDGSIAGPKALEHMVDTVISFERNSDEIRFLRSQKNRFGSVDELGIFAMEEKGLIPIEDPSSLFITRREGKLPAGIAVVPVFEGSRVFMVEIQALTIPTKTTLARITCEKIDSARISRIAAVLEKRIGIKFSDQDIFVNVAGGVRLTESAIDLALAAALYSARVDLPCPEHTALAGELSLAGEVRPVNRLKQRSKTAQSLGYTKIITPEKESGTIAIGDIKGLISELFSPKK